MNQTQLKQEEAGSSVFVRLLGGSAKVLIGWGKSSNYKEVGSNQLSTRTSV